MSMSKADFVAIADVLDANHAPLDMVQDMADMCERSNERFNRALFIRAATANITDDAERTLDRLARAQLTRT